ncbi:CDP-alcohol phosphatidyltransferase family protein [Sphingosinicellaceae bacterium]|nr:CDP-alcohol phosphatidyltransferase family protein [Sphingosinicellaceae bacterium]
MSATAVVRIDYPGTPATTFGLSPATRLDRQLARLKPAASRVLMVASDAIVDTPALAHLLAGEPLLVTDAKGRPLLGWVDPAMVDGLRDSFASGTLPAAPPCPVVVAGSFDFASGTLKKREKFLAYGRSDDRSKAPEDALYFASFKGVTDLVTKYAWPHPALLVVRACVALGITPNMVTTLSTLLSIAAIPLLMTHWFAAGLACAWGMTFLDTVDGKLARVTVSYSKFGNYFDHIPDIVFPPIWWWAFMWGAMIDEPPAGDARLWICFGLIMASYVVGRLCEGAFELRNGFGPFVWRPFDARFRLILARRNPNLLILTVALALGMITEGYRVLVAWCVICAVIQLARLGQSELARRRGPLVSFLQGDGSMAPSNPLSEIFARR